jgi:hypothetical protein
MPLYPRWTDSEVNLSVCVIKCLSYGTALELGSH